MALSKPINKKSFYGGNETGELPDIAMPPLDEVPAIQNAAPDPWQQQSLAPQQQENPFSVPEELPDDVRNEMSAQEQQYEEPEEEQPVQQTQQKASPKDSFKSVRDAKDKAERERDAILSQMLEMQQRMQSMQQQQQPIQDEPAEDYDIDIDSDALVEGKHVNKVTAKLKAMEKQLKRYQAQSEEVAVEARIRAQYPDFEKVVSPENVAILNEQFPEIARTLRDTPDIYNKAASAYTVIKNFGIHKDTPKFANDRAKAVTNSQKPRPLSSVSPQQGDSPLSRANAFANGMTDELKEQLRREMFSARKNM